ncbi:expressed protein [Echinococcus multilocularis]|uniref:Expressed protein n=1 Tax=Echinococcus multilocularis TaxID=6211 RepID=A0A068YB08_ECHMU|nr:expressed protein [Echinococcus multilocularis]
MCRSVFNAVRLLLYVISVSGLNQSRKLTDLSIGIIRSASESKCHLFVEKRDEVSVTFSECAYRKNVGFLSPVRWAMVLVEGPQMSQKTPIWSLTLSSHILPSQ